MNHCGGNCLSLLLRIEAHFKHLCRCLDILLNFGHALMKELLAMCKTVSRFLSISIMGISLGASLSSLIPFSFRGLVGQGMGMRN